MYEIKEIPNLSSTDELFKKSGIKRPEDCDSTIGIYSGGKLIGTASIRGNILMGFAISEEAQGEGLLATLCTQLINIGTDSGYGTFYMFYQAGKSVSFEAGGFKRL